MYSKGWFFVGGVVQIPLRKLEELCFEMESLR